ncbi:MAG: hypothetical protein ABI353_13945, partial [Isosphaeraceae bacterium]
MTATPLPRAEATPLAFAGARAFTPSPPPPPPEPPPTPPCEVPPECCEYECSAAPVRYFNGEVQLAVTDRGSRLRQALATQSRLQQPALLQRWPRQRLQLARRAVALYAVNHDLYLLL